LVWLLSNGKIPHPSKKAAYGILLHIPADHLWIWVIIGPENQYMQQTMNAIIMPVKLADGDPRRDFDLRQYSPCAAVWMMSVVFWSLQWSS
jgi:hypothetical protein